MSDFLLHIASVASIYAIIAVSLNIQVGYAGLLNLGHIAFVGIGAYSIGIAHAAGLPPLSGAAGGVTVAAAFGWFMARLGRNLGADYWGIATLAVAEILRTVALNENWLTGGAQGISGLPPLFPELARPWDRIAFLLTTLAVLAALALVCARLGDGRFGRALRLMREQPALATSFGYDLVALKSKAAVMSAAVASVAGVFLGFYMSFVGPDYMVASETFLIWTMVMIGGVGSVRGVVLGAFIVQAVYAAVPFVKDHLAIGSDVAGAVRLGLIGMLLLACLLWRREGLVPERLRVIR